MKILILLFVGWSGYRLGKSDFRIRPIPTIATVVLVVILHGVVRLTLPHEAIERFADQYAWSALSVVLVGVALLETVGAWATVLLIPWAPIQTRMSMAAYLMGGATIGAFAYYQPFDGRDGPGHPEYEAAWLFAIVVAIVPFVVGLILKRRKLAALANP
jgi:hypothetical protein